MNSLLNALNADQEQMQAWRHHLHRHPEVAFDEHNTARYIADLLRGWGYAVTEGVGKTGVVASLTVGDGKKAIGLRADTDALADEAEEGYEPEVIKAYCRACDTTEGQFAHDDDGELWHLHDEVVGAHLATATPDNLLPSAASAVQKKLGAVNAAVFDLNAA